MEQSDVLQPSSRLDFAPGLCSGRRRQQLMLCLLSHPRPDRALYVANLV